jgi:hypothetical protein
MNELAQKLLQVMFSNRIRSSEKRGNLQYLNATVLSFLTNFSNSQQIFFDHHNLSPSHTRVNASQAFKMSSNTVYLITGGNRGSTLHYPFLPLFPSLTQATGIGFGLTATLLRPSTTVIVTIRTD